MFKLSVILKFGCLCVVLGMLGCGPGALEVLDETDEKQYQRAQLYLDQGRTQDALTAFLGVIDVRPDAAESHFEAGYIYLHEMKDPVPAIYHFTRYLEFKPESDQAKQVKQLIETAEKEFARQLPAQPYEGNLHRLHLMDLVKNLRQENESLKAELVAAESRLLQMDTIVQNVNRVETAPVNRVNVRSAVPDVSESRSAEVTAAESDPASVPRVYVVQSGDSLSTISRKFYNTPSRWIEIYQANRDRLSSENALKVGQELRIP